MGVFKAESDGSVKYLGNKIFPAKTIDLNEQPSVDEMKKRVVSLHDDKMWGHIAKINHQINKSTNEFFHQLGSLFTILPLTTRMISSPGAVYGKEAISYTTDTSPIKLKWFDLPRQAFLAESSQIYLEIALMQEDVDSVYAIYNSFRKEEADATHLSEFHHVEYEGQVDQQKNEEIILKYTKRLIDDLIKNNEENLRYFLTDQQFDELKKLSEGMMSVPKISFKEALKILYEETKDEKYLEFTLKHFSSWEEIKLTNLLNNLVVIEQFPVLEVPFYHKTIKEEKVAKNSDFIWPGYREFIGSGERISTSEELEEKSVLFDLPKEDYKPYLQTRELKGYKTSSGFGMGWERFIQGLLCMPFIWSASQFPRVNSTLKP